MSAGINVNCMHKFRFYPLHLTSDNVSSSSLSQSSMPLLKKAPKFWEALKLKEGIYARLPKHYLESLEQKEPTPVHWRPLGVQYRANPKTGHKERVQDVPIPIYYPPQSQDGLWGGEGWIRGYRYANDDKVRSCHSLLV